MHPKFSRLSRRIALTLASSLVAVPAGPAQEPPAVPPAAEPAPEAPPEVDSPPEPQPVQGEPFAPDPVLEGDPQLPPASALFPPEGEAPPAPPAGGANDFAIHLINRLVQRGVLTRADAVELVQLAEADSARNAHAVAAAAIPAGPVPDPNDVRVPYVPEIVRDRIRDEVKSDILREFEEGGWAAPSLVPDWLDDIDLHADFRLRYEFTRFPEGNDNTGAFPNFNSINTGSPFDVSGIVFSPQYNVDQDRDRFRIRARFGAEFDLDDNFTMGFQLGTGDSNSPVSGNQSLGLAGQRQGGNFSKYEIWLNRSFLKYELADSRDRSLTLLFGRFDNPFFGSEVAWDGDLGFDGFALAGRFPLTESVTPFLTAGAFPVFNTDFHFSSNQPAKFESGDKWLYAIQAGVDLKLTDHLSAKLAAAWYDFQGIEGQLSDPFTPLSPSDAGNTDNTRPSFAQKGNTYRPLRNIVPGPLNDFGTAYQYQYFGLATPFREAVFTGRVDYTGFEPFTLSLLGEYIRNTAFDRQRINTFAVNNRGPIGADGSTGMFDGDDTAWIVDFRFGRPALEKRGDWYAGIGYRWVGSDAVVDGLTESDFAGGGTNVKGWTAGGAVALSKNVNLGLRWMGADQIAGPPLKSDIIQVDLTAKF